MDMGGFNWLIMDVVAVLVLLAVIVWVVLHTRSKGKKASPDRTERATHELYEEEERRRREGTDDL